LTVAPDVCVQYRAFRRTTMIGRDDVSRVLYEKRDLYLGLFGTVSFLDTYGNRFGLSFVPLRPGRVLDALVLAGWPVWAERVHLLGERTEIVIPGAHHGGNNSAEQP
ncbi:hypothetical protein, partial [Frankia sp. CpI1-P]